MATIRKRNGKWQVQVRKDGHTLSRTFQGKADAEVWARDRERQIERGELPSPCGSTSSLATLGDVLRRYREEITPRKRSARQEAWRIGRLLRHPVSQVTLRALRATHLAAYRDGRLQQVGSQMVRHELNVVLHALKVARMEWGRPIELGAFQRLPLPALSRAREIRIAPPEWNRMQSALATGSYPKGFSELVQVALATGMRKGELLGLRQQDLDLARQRLFVGETKNGHPRTVPLSQTATQHLRALNIGEASPVFALSLAQVRRAWGRLTRTCGIPDRHFHDLRHEAISRLFEKGLSLPEVALISGHRDIKMLMRYTHLQIDKSLYTKLETLLERTAEN